MEFTVVTSFLGTLLALAVSKTVERVVTRRLEAGELARDALVDLASALTAMERALSTLLIAKTPEVYADLAGTPSGWDLPASSMKLERLLGIFDDEQIHRLAILYYERFDHFAKRSKQHEDAYYWLLDHPSIDWSKPQAAERTGRIRVIRGEMLNDVRQMMQFGYELAESLFHRAKRPGLPSVLRPCLSDFLKQQFDLDEGAIRLRRAFYSLRDVPFVFEPDVKHILFTWNDAAAVELDNLNGVLALEIEFINGRGETLTGTVMIPPHVEVALPDSAVAYGGWVGWSRHSLRLEGFRFASGGLPNDGDGRRRFSLAPKDVDILQRVIRRRSPTRDVLLSS